MISQGPYSYVKLQQELNEIKTKTNKWEDYSDYCFAILSILTIPAMLSVIYSGLAYAAHTITSYPLWCDVLVVCWIISLIGWHICRIVQRNIMRKHWKQYNNYHSQATKVPISEIIDYIDVDGIKVVIPELTKLSDTYYYTYNPDKSDKRQIFRLEANELWEEYKLHTRGGARHELTYEEYKIITSKDKSKEDA